MSLWGLKKDKKPAWLSKEQQENCIATERGWVLKRKNGTEELLVSIPGLLSRHQKPEIVNEQPKQQVQEKQSKTDTKKENIKPEVKKEHVVEQPKEVIAEPVIIEEEKIEE